MANHNCTLTKFRKIITDLSLEHNCSIDILDDNKLYLWQQVTIKINLNGMLSVAAHYLIFELLVDDSAIVYCIWRLYPNSNGIPLIYMILDLNHYLEGLNYAFEQLTCWANYDSNNKNFNELFD